MDTEMIEEINKYYILKKKYEDTVTNEKKKILKNESLSTADKRVRFKEMVFKCIKCKQKGGTIFTNENNILKAVCGSSAPCDLAIEIIKGKILQLREILDMDLTDRAVIEQKFIKKYNDIVDNKNKELQLKTYISKLNLEIDNIKKLNKLYQSDKKDSILKTILENYTGLIQPLLDEIRELKYSYLTIEVDEKQNMSYFIAEPYTISQIENNFN